MKKLLLFVLALTLCLSCSKSSPDTSQPHLMGATASPGQVGPFIYPASWTQANWFVDPSNTSTCASDNNRTCSLGTCGTAGDGPCLSYGSITSRWGTTTPRLKQNTVINAMSSDTSDADIWYLGPFGLEQQSSIIVQGTLSTVLTTTLSAVTVKNRATPQLLSVTFTSGTGLAAGQLVTNTTHSSRAWLYKVVSGTTWLMSQPMVIANPYLQGPASMNACTGYPTEVNTWAPTDAVTVSTVPQINIAAPGTNLQSESSNDFANGLILYNVGARAPSGGASVFSPLQVGSLVQFVESQSNLPIYPTFSGTLGQIGQSFVNCSLLNGILPSVGPSLSTANNSIVQDPLLCFSAGYTGGGAGGPFIVAPTFAIVANDFIFGPAVTSRVGIVYGSIQEAYLDGTTIVVGAGVNITAATPPMTAGGPFIWGTGAINVIGKGFMTYPSGAGGAVAAFLQTGGFLINSQTHACLGIPTVGTPTLTCNIVVSATTLDSNLGATAGCLWVEGGGSICNYAN